MTRRILFAWELGANLGHLTRDLSVAVRLRDMGNEVFFAVRDCETAEGLLAPNQFSFLPVPLPPRGVRPPGPPINYSDMLVGQGYAEHTILAGLVRAWLHIFTSVRADVVVIDHAPTALLAARVGATPAILVGSGFEIPPNLNPLPSIRTWESIDEHRLKLADRTFLEAMNSVLKLHHALSLERVCDLFGDSSGLLATFPGLDCFGPRADREYVGPLATNFMPSGIQWSATHEGRIFVYLRSPFTDYDSLFGAFTTLDMRADCFIPRHSVEFNRRYATSKLRLFSDPLPLSMLLPKVTAMVTYGGEGTIAASLLAGVPMILIPNAVEHYLNSSRVSQLGAGIVLERQSTRGDYVTALTAIKSDARYRESARVFSHNHREFSAEHALQRTASVIESLA